MRRWRLVRGVADLPGHPGCYAVYHDGRLVYIGSSVHLSSRVAQYFSKKRSRPTVSSGARFDPRDNKQPNVTVKVAPTLRRGEWLMREYRLIERLRPRDNKLWTGSFRQRA